MAISALGLILQQQKRKTLKVPVDVAREGELKSVCIYCFEDTFYFPVAKVSSMSTDLKPGEKDENIWYALCSNASLCSMHIQYSCVVCISSIVV